MSAIGVTGHQMREGIDWHWVRGEVQAVLGKFDKNSVVWTCLATGADTIVAEEALASGMRITAVIPHANYTSLFEGSERQVFLSLKARAGKVVTMAPVDDEEQAYLNAGLRVADESDLLIVIWDGRPAAGKGGTGDVAEYARERGKSVIWLDTQSSCVRDILEAHL